MEYFMRVLWYLPANLIKGILLESVIAYSSKPQREYFMRVLWYLPANLIKGVLFEGVMVPSSKPHKGSTL
jgi:hypothetical protein